MKTDRMDEMDLMDLIDNKVTVTYYCPICNRKTVSRMYNGKYIALQDGKTDGIPLRTQELFYTGVCYRHSRIKKN